MLVGAWVGLTVAVGRGVVLGEGVGGGVWVLLGLTAFAEGGELIVLLGVSTLTGLQPVMIKNRNSPNTIPAITLGDLLLLPLNSFMFDGRCSGLVL